MKDTKIYTLYSGSGGNSTFIKVGDTRILIDAGKSARALCRSLCDVGEDINDIDAIFITHEHSDHVSALEVLSKKHRIPIHITEASALSLERLPAPALLDNLCCHEIGFCEQVGELKITSFRTPHDSRMSVGYRIEFEDSGCEYAIGFATDIGYVSDEIRKNLTGCRAVVIESNHDVDMLMHGPYPRELKLRVSSKRGHLSNAECAELASELAQSGTEAFMLAHLSKENNEPTLALDEIRGAVEEYGAYVCVARPDEPVQLIIDFCEEHNDKREVYNPWNA